ncbi:MRG-domain-containing protein [Amylostereum chailletii]|nr:MRG-domain-containing protein [Amylostereum chailletii]
MSTPVTFQANEQVLCYHGPLIYEAKVLKSETWDAATTMTGAIGANYFVHYKGWKQTWDEWVEPHRLLKYNEENLAKKKSLQEQQAAHNASAAPSAKATTSVKASASGVRRKEGGRGTKRARDEDDVRRPELRFAVPEVLKMMLVDDWEAVTKNYQLVTLPRSPTVAELLQQFREDVLAANPPKNLRDPTTLLPTIIAGLQVYFDRALGNSLLYRFERPQYADVRKQYITGQKVIIGQEKQMSQIYGAEHLLRMIVSLPQMVAGSTMDPESVGLLRDYVIALLDWMVENRDRLFQKEYETSSLQYQNISRS